MEESISALRTKFSACSLNIPIRKYTCDLENAVHPVFARHNFLVAKYEPLIPALRLASYLISTDCLLDFWHAVFFPNIKEVVTPGKTYEAYFRKGSQLTPAEIAATKDKLEQLANHVSFTRLQVDDFSCHAHTISDRPMLERKGQTAGYFDGFSSTIRFSDARYYQPICVLHQEARSSGDKLPSDLMKMYFRFAVTLVHELVHAAHAAVHGHVDIPFEDLEVSEAGYDWTNCVFGGVPKDNLEQIKEWPNAENWTGERAHQPRGGVFFLRPPQEKRATMWTIPASFVPSLFQRSFWEETVKEKGAEAVKIPKVDEFIVKPVHSKALKTVDFGLEPYPRRLSG